MNSYDIDLRFSAQLTHLLHMLRQVDRINQTKRREREREKEKGVYLCISFFLRVCVCSHSWREREEKKIVLSEI